MWTALAGSYQNGHFVRSAITPHSPPSSATMSALHSARRQVGSPSSSTRSRSLGITEPMELYVAPRRAEGAVNKRVELPCLSAHHISATESPTRAHGAKNNGRQRVELPHRSATVTKGPRLTRPLFCRVTSVVALPSSTYLASKHLSEFVPSNYTEISEWLTSRHRISPNAII